MFQISTDCACCHNCRMECPREAIQFSGLKYEIDQEKCVECGRCAVVCHTGACHEVDAPAAIPHEPFHLSADIVVCGSGTGLIAATRAAQQGMKVIVLEKNNKIGGNTDYAHVFMPVYTKWYQELGMKDIREDAIEHYKKITGGHIDEACIRTAVYGCGEFFDWLCDNSAAKDYFFPIDISWMPQGAGPIFGNYLLGIHGRYKDNIHCRDEAIGPGKPGTFVKYACLDTMEREQLDVSIYTSCAAKHLHLDEQGRICGVSAEDAGGKIEIDCKAVILQTGGFGRSDEKLQKYYHFFDYDPPIHRFSVRSNQGDAMDMLEELGVAPDTDRMLVSGHGPKHHPFSNVLAEMALFPTSIQVTLSGKRFLNESLELFATDGIIDKEPKQISYSIGNYKFFSNIANELINHPGPLTVSTLLYDTWYSELEEEATLDIPVKKADTLEELAVACGIDPEIFLETIRNYNSYCETGEDKDFGKPAQFLAPLDMNDGPYYAIYGQKFCETAIGGIRVNGKCEVLREDYKTIIPGLYSGGDASSAMMYNQQNAAITELTWATSSAFTSGGNAVTYLRQEYPDVYKEVK